MNTWMRTGIPFLLAGIFFVLPVSVSAATIYANSSTGHDSSGDGSVGAPYKTFHKAYTSASTNDTLDLTGTFTWTDADETGDSSTTGYTIAKNLLLQGRGPGLTIIQASSTANTGNARVFTIATNASTTMQDLTLRYGYHSATSGGGCLYGNGTTDITLNRVEIHDCRVTTSSTGGGAIVSFATTTINNSAIYANTAVSGGGGIYVSGSGARLYITNSTIYGNFQTNGSAGGAGLQLYSSAQGWLTNTTIVGNTGAYGGGVSIYNSAVLNTKNTIISDNIGSNAAWKDFYNSTATFASNGYNIVGRGSGTFSTTGGDWTDTNSDGIFILQDDGVTTGSLNLETEGGLNDNPTRTRSWATLSGSIAINNGTAGSHGIVSVPLADQRGATRAGATDIGAYEYGGGGLVITAPTTQASGIVFSSATYNSFTLSWTNGNGSRHVVFMKQGSSGTASPVDGTQYAGNRIFGSGAQIGSSGWYALYDGNASTAIAVSNLLPATSYIVQIFEYNGIDSGASKYLTTTAADNPKVGSTYTPVTLYINSAMGSDAGSGTSGSPYKTFTTGYAAANGGDTLNISGTFDWTSPEETGDASTTGFTLAKDLTITGQGADVTFVQATSTDNTASNQRVFTTSTSASTTIQNLTLRHGKITGTSGGCVQSGNGTSLTLRNVEIYGCRTTFSSGSGGGLATFGTTTIENSSIYNNSAVSSGGGLYAATGSRLDVKNSTIYGNTQTNGSGGGAGLQVTGSGVIGTLTNVTVTGNTGAYGGGVSVYASAILYIRNTIIAGNTGSNTAWKDYFTSSATLSSNGYNIVAKGSGTYSATTGDWTDTNNDGTYDLYSVGTTGTLDLDSAAALNDNPQKTRTWALLADSIAIDRGSGAGNNYGVAIPVADQRGALISNTIDIGAFEFEGTFAAPSQSVASVGTPTILRFPSSPTFQIHNIKDVSVLVSVNNNNQGVVLSDSGLVYRVNKEGKDMQISIPGAPTWYEYPLRGLECGTSYLLSPYVANSLGTQKAPPLVFSTKQCPATDTNRTVSSSESVQTTIVASSTAAIAKSTPRDLTLKAEGTDVVSLQQLLVHEATGPASLALKRIGATGYFGSYTRQALAEYQGAHKIIPSVGYFGPITRSHMSSVHVEGIWW